MLNLLVKDIKDWVKCSFKFQLTINRVNSVERLYKT
jgi:hypothetical protein